MSVKCAICGDTSHPTRDCVQNKAGAGGIGDADGNAAKNAEEADEDYLNFMAELDGKPRAEGGDAADKASSSAGASGGASVGNGGASGGGPSRGLLPMCQPVGSCSAVTTISSTIEGRMKKEEVARC